MKNLGGKTALVTGASRGIGVYIAEALASAGMRLVLAARSADDLEAVRQRLAPTGAPITCIPTDLADRTAVVDLVERAEAVDGGVAVLVNNAALEQAVPFDLVDAETIDRVLEVNLRAPMILTRLLLPRMLARGEGHVVNVSSVAGLMGAPYDETYSATKHALMGFTRSLRGTAMGEGWPVGISAVCPGFVSEAGMYEQMRREGQVEAPIAFGTSPPDLVAREVLRVIRNDLPEIIVNPRPLRHMLVLGALAPRVMAWVGRATGGIAFFKRLADERRRRR